MKREYFDDWDCPVCGRETPQLFHDAGHERDSSGDFRWCLNCGAMMDGWGDVAKLQSLSADEISRLKSQYEKGEKPHGA